MKRRVIQIVLLLLLLIGGVIALFVTLRPNPYSSVGRAAKDLGFVESPSGRNRVRVFIYHRGALGWDHLWVFAPPETGDNELLLSTKIQSSSPLPVDWIDDSTLQIRCLTERDESVVRTFVVNGKFVQQ